LPSESERTPDRAGEPATVASSVLEFDPGLGGDRTALAWTRSSLSLAGNGVLLARAALIANDELAGLMLGVAFVLVSLLIWRHAVHIYPHRRLPDTRAAHHQARAFRLLVAVTVVTVVLATALSVALAVGGA
jgi:uncharacterized membrane protein YidH (DUF202 family)